MTRWRPWGMGLCLVACLATPLALRAQDDAADDAVRAASDEAYVEAGREALGEGKTLPWYDAETDDIRAIDVPVDDKGAFDNRKSRWNSRPASPTTGTGLNAPSFSLGTLFWEIIYYLFIGLAIGVVAYVFYLLVRAYVRGEEAAAGASTRAAVSEADEEDVERMESLPFTVARPRGDLLDEALAQYQGGNFRQAVIYLYSYLLIQLDRHQQIHLARGKTNRMYLRELRRQPRLREILELTMTAFEDVFFGNHTLTREQFEACWRQLDDFHKHVEQVAA